MNVDNRCVPEEYTNETYKYDEENKCLIIYGDIRCIPRIHKYQVQVI